MGEDGESRREAGALDTGRPPDVFVAQPRYLHVVMVPAAGVIKVIQLSTVESIESDRNYVSLVAGGETYRLRVPLTTLKARLDPTWFVRVSRSALVNLAHTREITWVVGSPGCVMLQSGRVVRASRGYRARLSRMWRGLESVATEE